MAYSATSRPFPQTPGYPADGTPLEDVWRKHGYIGAFFASYIQAPEDMAIYLIGRSRPGRGDATPRWIKYLPQRHGVAASHRPAGSTWDFSYDEGPKLTLASGFSDFEFPYPRHRHPH